jgi:hypothetical protein
MGGPPDGESASGDGGPGAPQAGDAEAPAVAPEAALTAPPSDVPGAAESVAPDVPDAAEGIAAATVAPSEPVAATGGTPTPAAEPPKSSNRLLLVGLGALLVALLAVAGGLIYYILQGGGGQDYPTDLPDDQYDLPSMSLRMEDVGDELVLARRLEFNNEDWAQITGEDDPERKLSQLESQGRVRNNVAFLTWPDGTVGEHLGETLSVTSQSTLFTDADAASAEQARLCGLLIDERDPLEEFEVPKIGDESVGFAVSTVTEGFGTSIDTVVCFRTGRIVHGVVQTGLKGADDRELTIELAERMLDRVDETFAGNPAPLDEEEASQG